MLKWYNVLHRRVSNSKKLWAVLPVPLINLLTICVANNNMNFGCQLHFICTSYSRIYPFTTTLFKLEKKKKKTLTKYLVTLHYFFSVKKTKNNCFSTVVCVSAACLLQQPQGEITVMLPVLSSVYNPGCTFSMTPVFH